ncbi:hypothetical protein M0651_07805 [Paenibacillus sp. MBLB2552]|uniref:Uncharacterized protein n=1 Tax=Paenibacillus mellifer TaxID=2937794 RepID=A0A9X2BR82_9BACL|nr:hypothetical protein [Paenibacillus mellifer]MCK8487070.1 hypothetical protein [Paenibacillus mellifer]
MSNDRFEGLNLITYDFKNEDPCEEVRDEKDPFRKFELYKNSKSNFDCDSSKLAYRIYKLLWGWNYRNRFSIPDNLKGKLEATKWERLGPDTMNSFLTTYNHACKIYSQDHDKVRDNYSLKKFASLTHSIGNFTLVPFKLDFRQDVKSFNQNRGWHGSEYFVYDYFDLSLKLIKETVSETGFKAYIDTFYLNDYVDHKYDIIPLFRGHVELLKEDKLLLENPNRFLPTTEAELIEYLRNVLEKIESRGIRIVKELLNKNLIIPLAQNRLSYERKHNKIRDG